MHYVNTIINKIEITLFCILCLCSCDFSKSNNSITTPNFDSNKCDSIIYELPNETTNKILSIIGSKKVVYCNLVSNTNDSEYIFSFPYTDKYHFSKKDSILIKKTITYLKLENNYYPIINYADYLFSNIQSEEYINDFNFCFVTINAQGKVINGFAY